MTTVHFPIVVSRFSIRSFLLASMFLTSACERDTSDTYQPGRARKVMGIQMGEVKRQIATRLDSVPPPSWVASDDWRRMRAMYRRFGDAPLWLESNGVRDRASALLRALEQAPAHGLSTNAYPLDSVRAVVNAEALAKNKHPAALAAADVMLSAAYVAYASDMLAGQTDPKTLSQSWHISASRGEIDSALVRTLQSVSIGDGLEAMVPQDSGYLVLQQEYNRYKEIDAAGGWPAVTDSVKDAGSLVSRLSVEGYVVDTVRIADALRLYQERHGLASTGRVDAPTRRALSIPASERLHQIATNLERYRWLPRSLGKRYIVVNVPSFRLEAYDSGQKRLEMKVVVGAEYDGRATPVFSDSMETVVFRPYWNVTPAIAAKEFFPKYGNDLPAGYETWKENGELRIRQRPGDQNSLGLVKFMFPNDFNIYLHDTPAKALFKETGRAASHGCIRLEKPAELAEFVLGWSPDSVQEAMHGADNRTIKLPGRIPVYIVYFTSYVRDGSLYFADDLYDRDERVDDRFHRADTATVKPIKSK